MRKLYFPIISKSLSLYENYTRACDQHDVYDTIDDFVNGQELFIDSREPINVGVMEESEITDSGYTVKFSKETYQVKIVKVD